MVDMKTVNGMTFPMVEEPLGDGMVLAGTARQGLFGITETTFDSKKVDISVARKDDMMSIALVERASGHNTIILVEASSMLRFLEAAKRLVDQLMALPDGN